MAESAAQVCPPGALWLISSREGAAAHDMRRALPYMEAFECFYEANWILISPLINS